MFGKIVCAGALGAAVLFAGGGVASAAQSGSCSTSGLTSSTVASRYKVVSLIASGVPCTRARSVAQTVAGELTNGKPVSVVGVQGFAINSTMCSSGCESTTQVQLTYASGRITIALGGKPSSQETPIPSPSLPAGSGPLVLE